MFEQKQGPMASFGRGPVPFRGVKGHNTTTTTTTTTTTSTTTTTTTTGECYLYPTH
jgi:hypothetical protein